MSTETEEERAEGKTADDRVLHAACSGCYVVVSPGVKAIGLCGSPMRRRKGGGTYLNVIPPEDQCVVCHDIAANVRRCGKGHRW